MKQTIEQQRAAKAWEKVEKVTTLKDLKPVADGASALIQKIGFGQAVAFWISASNKSNQNLANMLSDLLLNDAQGDGNKLMKEITTWNSDKYRIKTNEALAYLFWIKRFVKAKAPKD